MPHSHDQPSSMRRQRHWETVKELLNRPNWREDAKQAFVQAYPNAPENMINTAVFHTYVDGIGAAIDWLVDLELFLRNPDEGLDSSLTSSHLLYHLYNWHQFQALLPDGKAGILERLQEIREAVQDGDIEAILSTVEELEDMINGMRTHPNLDG